MIASTDSAAFWRDLPKIPYFEKFGLFFLPFFEDGFRFGLFSCNKELHRYVEFVGNLDGYIGGGHRIAKNPLLDCSLRKPD